MNAEQSEAVTTALVGEMSDMEEEFCDSLPISDSVRLRSLKSYKTANSTHRMSSNRTKNEQDGKLLRDCCCESFPVYARGFTFPFLSTTV